MQTVNESPNFFRSSAARPGTIELITTAVREVLSRRRLIRYLTRAEIHKQGTDTVLGNVWWVLDPLLSMLVYVVVMTFIFQRNVPDFPAFLLCAMIPFKWFTISISHSVSSVFSQGQLIKQIQFPKIVLPLTSCMAEVVNLCFGFAVLSVVYLVLYRDHLSITVVWVPVIAAVQFVLTLGLALILSSVTVFYRDVGNFISHIMRLLFYMAPILWSFDDLAGRGGELEKAFGPVGFKIMENNPIAILLQDYRHAIYGVVSPTGDSWSQGVPPNLIQLGGVLVLGLVLCALGALVFKRLEPAFAKVL